MPPPIFNHIFELSMTAQMRLKGTLKSAVSLTPTTMRCLRSMGPAPRPPDILKSRVFICRVLRLLSVMKMTSSSPSLEQAMLGPRVPQVRLVPQVLPALGVLLVMTAQYPGLLVLKEPPDQLDLRVALGLLAQQVPQALPAFREKKALLGLQVCKVRQDPQVRLDQTE